VKRRDVITKLGGAAVAWPFAGRAQVRVRRVGVLLPLSTDDPLGQANLAIFQQALLQLG